MSSSESKTPGLSSEDFAEVRKLFEGTRRKTRPRKHDLFDVFCSILFLLREKRTWRSMPADFPPWRTVHEYYTQWTGLTVGNVTLLEHALSLLGRTDELEYLRTLLAKTGTTNSGLRQGD